VSRHIPQGFFLSTVFHGSAQNKNGSARWLNPARNSTDWFKQYAISAWN
jgi:hypothetical protein